MLFKKPVAQSLLLLIAETEVRRLNVNTILDNSILVLVRSITKSYKETNPIFIRTQIIERLEALHYLQTEATDMVVLKLPCHVHMCLVFEIKVYQNRLSRIGS